MSCINFIAYVQRQIDRILRFIKRTRVYVDDIVCDSKSLQEHINNLRELFILLIKTNVFVNSIKTFLD